jgi:hypothetical protein
MMDGIYPLYGLESSFQLMKNVFGVKWWICLHDESR